MNGAWGGEGMTVADMRVGGWDAGSGRIVCMSVWMWLERGGEEMVVERGSGRMRLGLEMKGTAFIRRA